MYTCGKIQMATVTKPPLSSWKWKLQSMQMVPASAWSVHVTDRTEQVEAGH